MLELLRVETEHRTTETESHAKANDEYITDMNAQAIKIRKEYHRHNHSKMMSNRVHQYLVPTVQTRFNRFGCIRIKQELQINSMHHSTLQFTEIPSMISSPPADSMSDAITSTFHCKPDSNQFGFTSFCT